MEAAGKHALLEIVRNVIPNNINCIYIRQPAALGFRSCGFVRAPRSW